MQLPTVERTPNLRPAGADVAAPAAARVIPVAPVNPSLQAQESASVVNDINPQVQAHASQAGSADPLQGGAQADNSGRDWTQSREVPVKLAEPPKEPLSKMLLDQIHLVWSASARVVEIWLMNNPAQNQTQTQIQNLAQNRNQDPTAIPGVLAKEALTYSPSKIRKTEKPD
jgi:hypothetical protein